MVVEELGRLEVEVEVEVAAEAMAPKSVVPVKDFQPDFLLRISSAFHFINVIRQLARL